MAQRRIRWPAISTALLILAGTVLLLWNPELLAPAATRLINRHLQSTIDGNLRVGTYNIRPFSGLDAYDVTLTLRGERGGLTLVAVDTLALDFRLRDVIGRTIHLRRLEAQGIEVYHNQDPPAPPAEAIDDRGTTLPHLVIDLVDIRDGRVEVSDSDGLPREGIAEIAWRGEIAADGETLRVVSQGGHLEWYSRGAVLDRPYGTVVVDRDVLRVESLGALWNEGRVAVSGSFGPEHLDLTATGRNLSTEEVSDLTGLALDFHAAGDVDLQLTSQRDSLRLDLDFTGRVEEWDLQDAHGEALVTGDVATFHVLRSQVGSGSAYYDGNLIVDARDSEAVVISLTGEGRDLDLQTGLIPGDDELPHTWGHGRLEIVHTAADLATRVRGTLWDGGIEIMPFDTCRVDIWAVADSLHFHAIDLRRGSLRGQLTGASDRRQIFDGDLDLAIGDLRDLPPTWQWPELLGRLNAQLLVRGPLDSLETAGNVVFRDFALGPVTARTGQAAVVATNVLGEDWRLSAAAEGERFGLGGVPLGPYLLWAQADPASVVVDSFWTARGDTMATLRGHADIVPAGADLTLDRLRLDFAGNTWETTDVVRASAGPGQLQLPIIHLASEQGDLAASVEYSTADSLLSGYLELINFDLNLLNPLLEEDRRTGGHATAVVEVSGTPQRPEVTVQGGLARAAFPLARIDTLAIDASFVAGTVTVDSLNLLSEFGRIATSGTLSHPDVGLRDWWRGAALDLDLQIQEGDWAFLDQFALPALDRLAGQVDGQLHLSGTTDDPLVTGDLDSAPFHIHWLHLDRLTGSIRADHSMLALGQLRGHQDEFKLEGRLEIPLAFDLHSVPISPPDGPFYARLALPENTDLAPLYEATNAFIESSGRGRGEMIVSGPLSHPRYQGWLDIEGMGFVLRGNEEVYRNCSARGVFRDDQLIIQELRGEEGLKGTFAGAGTVTFEGLELKTWDITFRADRFLLASIPELRALVRTENGRLTGVTVGPDSLLVPRFTGDFELIRGRYTGNFSNGAGGADPTLGNIAPDWLADVRIVGPPRSARLQNRTMELDLSGDVSLVRDADGMILNGSMNIDTGRLPVFNNTFQVVRGRLDYSRAVGVVPNVDIDAETRVRIRSQASSTSVVERITVHATGPADAMTISYSSESGYPREAIERMLLGLSPYPDEQGDSGALANASIGAGLNILEREIAREIDLFDTIEIDQIQRQQAGSTGLDPLIGVGKYLGSDLYIKYAQGLNQNDRDLLIEYQITNHLLLQTEIRRRIDEYQGDATYNLDIKYRFEY